MSWGCEVCVWVLGERGMCVGVRLGCAIGVWAVCEGVGECRVVEWRAWGLIMRCVLCVCPRSSAWRVSECRGGARCVLGC